ncbi:MAG: flagellar biosynthetic protein FliR [Chloroflexota bacterium]|nr:flagellar biosynthetic protein FliR [Chloroflexota bacterium]
MTLTVPIGPVEAFVLIATRILAVMATSPVMSLRHVPVPARLGLGLFTALLLVPVVARDGAASDIEVTWAAIASEALVGALAGFAATVVYSAIQLGATLLDLQAGFTIASIYDAALGSQGSLIDRFYGALAALLFFQTDAHHLLIQAAVQLFTIVPLGGFALDKLRFETLARLVAGSFVVAVELVFPILTALLLADVALAVLARVAPQFGIFSVGLQVKVALALAALTVTMPLLLPRLHQLFSGVSAASLMVFR